jgi:hypothetical protein
LETLQASHEFPTVLPPASSDVIDVSEFQSERRSLIL